MDNLHTKDNTYHELAGNVYNTKSSDKETKIEDANGALHNFKIQASRVDKVNGFKQWRCSKRQ